MRGRFHRHDLVTIVPAARRSLAVEVLGDPSWWPADEVEQLRCGVVDGVPLPGIVSRQEDGHSGLAVGFATPFRQEGNRLRGRAVVPPAAVSLIRDPYQVIAHKRCTVVPDLPVFGVLDEAWALAAAAGLPCGVFGSVALQLASGLPFCHEGSDLDLVVKMGALDGVERFYGAVVDLAQKSGVAIDVELELPDGEGIKLAELFDGGATVLAKGFTGVRLMDKDEVRAMDHRYSLC